MATRMEQRRGTAAEWAATNPILADGEIGFERDTGIIKIGDGATAWNDIATAYVRRDAYVADGDLIVGTGNRAYARLPKGAVNQRLTILSDGTLAWADLPAEDNPYVGIAALGDLIVGTGPGVVTRLPRGAPNQRLTTLADNTLAWTDLPATPNPFTMVNAKGDLIVGTADDTVARLARGATNQQLAVAADGSLVWVNPVDISGLETAAHAASTYETQTHASSTYETLADIVATYETKAHALASYVPVATRLYKEKTTDLSRNNNTGSNDGDLSFGVDANSTWMFEGLLFVDGDLGDIKIAINGPAGSDVAFAAAGPQNTASTGSNATGEWVGRAPAAPLSQTIPFGTVAGSRMGIHVRGRIKVGVNAGLCTLWWGQLTTAAGSPTTMVAGSFLKAERALP